MRHQGEVWAGRICLARRQEIESFEHQMIHEIIILGEEKGTYQHRFRSRERGMGGMDSLGH